MMPGTPGFYGARLTEAREARGLSGVSLADLVGVKPQTITAYEHNKATPGPDAMEALSRQLKFPVSYFLRPPQPLDDAPIFWRSASSATKIARERAEKRVLWMKEIVGAFERSFFDFPEVRLPDLSLPREFDFRSYTGAMIEEAAVLCRRTWGLGNGPIPHVVAEMEANGIIIGQIDVGVDNLDAFSLWSAMDGRPYVVLARDKESAVRSRFDAAHELAHLILHRHVDKKTLNKKQDFSILEQQAHRFAGAFLMPADSFVREIWSPTLDTFRAVKQRWGASIASMIMRFKHLGLVTEDQEKRLWINMARRGWREREPLDDKLEMERPRLLRRSVEMLISENVKNKQQVLLDMHLSATDAEEICALPRGYFSGREATVTALPRLRLVHDNGPPAAPADILDFGTHKKRG